MTTQTDVIVTQYRAEFRAAPFARPRWTIVSGWEHRDWPNKRRRRWTVEREFLTHPGTVSFRAELFIHASNLMDMDAVVVFVPDTQASRYGTAVVIEEIAR